MGHTLLPPGHGAYERLVQRLNRFPQGAPPSERLFQILRLLVSEEEAGLLVQVAPHPHHGELEEASHGGRQHITGLITVREIQQHGPVRQALQHLTGPGLG